MASSPIKFIDRRGMPRTSSNRMIESAIQTGDRKTVPMLDRDMWQNVSGLGRRTMMSIGRHLFWNYPILSGALKEMATLATSTFIPQFYGEDEEWGDKAENMLLEWHKIMDIRGPPFDFDSFLRHQITQPIVDGDIATLLTELPGGYPMIQQIPAHRIGSVGNRDTVVIGGEFDGATVIDGVVMGDYGAPRAYSIVDDRQVAVAYIPAKNMILNWNPQCCDQFRGISELASSLFILQDCKESRGWELLAQKNASTINLIEKNSTGFADEAKTLIASDPTETAETGVKTALTQEKVDGGQIRYFKAASGEGVEAFTYDRPGANTQTFQESMLRDAMRGMNWDHFFSSNIMAVGGAPLRVLIEKINCSIYERQKAVTKVCMRVDGYALSKFMKLGLLPWNDDWWKFEYQGPAEITADRKYELEGEIEEHEAGFTTLQDHCARRGKYWKDTVKQRIAEQAFIKKESEAAGIEVNRVQVIKGAKDPKEEEKKKEANKQMDR